MGLTGQDFTTWKGNYRKIVFYISDVSSVTGGTAEWAMSSMSDTGTTLITKTSDPTSGITLTGKNVTVILDPEDTDESSGIPPGEYYHELRLEDIAGQPTTPAIGTITMLDVLIKE
jgi:hypothetical protein